MITFNLGKDSSTGAVRGGASAPEEGSRASWGFVSSITGDDLDSSSCQVSSRVLRRSE